jgi:hypothetical protein
MATHILTVNENTFKTHLNYMFIGTGRNGYPHQNGALADILGIRENDNIIFYVMNKGFFGIFKAISIIFYESNHNQYLDAELNGKTLTYRMKIAPLEVYKNCITEWNMMENPENIIEQSIYNMQWSWIFKKLNATRGCLSLDTKESQLLKNILLENNVLLTNTNNYDYVNGQINILNNNLVYNTQKISLLPRNNTRLNKIELEEDLRILFTAKGNNHNILNQVLQPQVNGDIDFISNEVLCSFSERRMDLLFGTILDKCLLIELKNEFIFNNSIYNQIKEYARWISAYKSQYQDIIPILIIREARILSTRRGSIYFKYLSQANLSNDTKSEWYQGILNSISQAKINLQNENIDRLRDLKVYIFNTDENNKLISFESI